MAYAKLSLAAAIVGLASAAPQISLPPLIPAIPGVTEPLGGIVPPLPVLQVPTPPVDSPPHAVNTTLRPKKIGHFWAGAGDKNHKDFLATYSLDDDTFGELMSIADVPSSGNEPHHSGPSADGKYIWGGGLLSLLKTQDTGYYFDSSNPYKPKYLKSDRALLSAISDDVAAKPGGGFFYTYMGSAVGTSPGRLVETDENYNIIHQWPEDVDGTLNILGEQFSPHGLNIDFERGVILTSDFVVPLSVLKPSLGVVGANTVRVWDLATRTIVNTLTIPNGNGIQDVKFIPGHPEAAALASAVGLGQVWIIYPFRTDSSGKQGTIERFFDFGPDAAGKVAIFSDITKDGKYAYFTVTTGNHVVQLDISDISNPIRLDDPKEVHPTIGPHFIKITPDQKHAVIVDYFLQTGDIGIVNTPSDYKIHYADINNDGSLTFNRTISFAEQFPERGGARPHSVSIFDLSNPAAPKYF
ncbi:hypothetical protein LSUE1_G004658 [Lachnellula suecica]|uniref:Methanethiol oxidase n=1 Tax=Lachnellula suecica TaxID=602035 RepID=A0A8T9CC86_9HELO|nr:hypothetical protein LSUE1_G004658 [Lachnellula suecica]